MAGKADEIQALLAPTVASLGLELLGVEYVPSGAGALLRLYIDADGRQVGIEDCESASREVSALLDVEDPITSEYTLEVSSPGIDRPLFSVVQFARWAGEQAKVQLRLAKDGRRRFTGRIVSAAGDSIVMKDDTGEFNIAHDNIDKARLVPDLVALGLAAAPKPGGPRGKKSRPDAAAAAAGETDASDKLEGATSVPTEQVK